VRYDSFLPFAYLPSCTFLGTSTAVTPEEMKNNSYATFWGASKVYYGRGANGELEDLIQKIHILDKNLFRIPTSILYNDRRKTHSALNLL